MSDCPEIFCIIETPEKAKGWEFWGPIVVVFMIAAQTRCFKFLPTVNVFFTRSHEYMNLELIVIQMKREVWLLRTLSFSTESIQPTGQVPLQSNFCCRSPRPWNHFYILGEYYSGKRDDLNKRYGMSNWDRYKVVYRSDTDWDEWCFLYSWSSRIGWSGQLRQPCVRTSQI